MDLKQRRLEPELMDDPSVDPAALSQALAGLRRINRLSRSRWVMWRHLSRMAAGGTDVLRVLDLACGSGDLVRWLNSKAMAAGVKMVVDGCDINAESIRQASDAAERCKSGGEFFALDLRHDEIPPGYEVAMSSLFFHHLAEQDVVALLTKLRGSIGRAVLIDDLRRTATGYWLAQAGCRMLSRSPIVHQDGPSSVRGAFSIAEFARLAEEAGLKSVRFERMWPQRFLMIWSKP